MSDVPPHGSVHVAPVRAAQADDVRREIRHEVERPPGGHPAPAPKEGG